MIANLVSLLRSWTFKCSRCGHADPQKSCFCPNCGCGSTH